MKKINLSKVFIIPQTKQLKADFLPLSPTT